MEEGSLGPVMISGVTLKRKGKKMDDDFGCHSFCRYTMMKSVLCSVVASLFEMHAYRLLHIRNWVPIFRLPPAGKAGVRAP